MRLAWMLGGLLFRLTFRSMFATRRMILRIFGAEIGVDVQIYPSAKIYFPWNLIIGSESSIGENVLIYNLGKVIIGSQTTISHNAHICAGTHDYNNSVLPLVKSNIKIGSQVWICADAFICPGVVIDNMAVIGARSVVTKKVFNSEVVAGNPAKLIKMRELCD